MQVLQLAVLMFHQQTRVTAGIHHSMLRCFPQKDPRHVLVLHACMYANCSELVDTRRASVPCLVRSTMLEGLWLPPRSLGKELLMARFPGSAGLWKTTLTQCTC